jgi:cytochrome c oxidase assembly protein subunit 15
VLVRARTGLRVVGPKRFLQIALASLAALYVVVTTGAVVRLTASGLGCENWPQCGDRPFPEKGGHAVIEFSNRVVALTAMVLTLVAWLAARRTPGLPRGARRLALGVFVGTVAQIPLGGLTVLFELDPLLVMAHFLLALVVLVGAGVLALEGWSLLCGRAGPVGPAWWRVLAVLGAGACLILVVTGAVATAAGPHSGGEDIPRLGVEVSDAVYVHVRATALYGIWLLVFGGYLLRSRARNHGLLVGWLVLLGVLLAQMLVGEIQYRNALPWWLVLIHVALASGIAILTAALAYAAWRPPAPLVRRAA